MIAIAQDVCDRGEIMKMSKLADLHGKRVRQKNISL